MILFAATLVAALPAAEPRAIPDNARLADACRMIDAVPDACAIVTAAAEMLGPTYDKVKSPNGEERLKARGYIAKYLPTGGHGLNDVTKVFLVAKPQSNRLYVVVTGTETKRDWYENAKAIAYTTKWRDGYYYTPPGHAGFRSGVLNVIAGVLRASEYRPAGSMLVCPADGRASRLTRFLCDSRVQRQPGDIIELVLVGHSRGAAITTLLAPAFDGWTITVDAAGRRDVVRQPGWPLRLTALVGFAPPYAIYTRTDAAAGMDLKGAPDQWQVYDRVGVAPRALMFYNDRDIVPQLSLALGRQIGYRFRIGPNAGAVTFAGYGSPNSVSLIQAHGSGGYCQDVFLAMGQPDAAGKACDGRSYSEPAIGQEVGGDPALGTPH